MLSRCLLTKFLHRSSVRSLLRVHCWLGWINREFQLTGKLSREQELLLFSPPLRGWEQQRKKSFLSVTFLTAIPLLLSSPPTLSLSLTLSRRHLNIPHESNSQIFSPGREWREGRGGGVGGVDKTFGINPYLANTPFPPPPPHFFQSFMNLKKSLKLCCILPLSFKTNSG